MRCALKKENKTPQTFIKVLKKMQKIFKNDHLLVEQTRAIFDECV